MNRPAVRVVLLDEVDHVILVRFWDGLDSWWCPPGGGLEPRESYEDAAARELKEELGLAMFELGPCMWTRYHAGVFKGESFAQSERIYLGRTTHFTPTLTAYPEHPKADIRWWDSDEILASEEVFSPRRFPELFRTLLTEGPPPHTFDVGV